MKVRLKEIDKMDEEMGIKVGDIFDVKEVDGYYYVVEIGNQEYLLHSHRIETVK